MSEPMTLAALETAHMRMALIENDDSFTVEMRQRPGGAVTFSQTLPSFEQAHSRFRLHALAEIDDGVRPADSL